MSTHRNVDRFCAIIVLLSLVLTILFMNGERLGIALVVDADSEAHSDSAYFTSNDLDGDWDDSGATVITFSGDTIQISGSGAYVLDGDVVIVQSGLYVASGTLNDGKIVINAEKYSKIWLKLDGVTVTCSDDACIRVDQADKVFLTLAAGSENSLTSGESYSEAALADGTNAVIFTHDDLTINGSGSLTVTAGYQHGITAKDDLVITGGTISVKAPQDGLHVNDTVRLTGMNLTIAAGDDAIHSDTEVDILGGTVMITACYEGIEAVIIQLLDGDVTVYATDDALNANGNTGDMMGGGGQFGGEMPDMSAMPAFPGDRGESGVADSTEEPASGTADPNTAGPAATEESSAAPTQANTDGTAPDMSAMPTPGDWPSDGTTPDMSAMAGFRMDASADSASDTQTIGAEETYVRIAGGTLTIINENGNDADGIDSNGCIYMTGGTVRVYLTNSNNNTALDFGSENGGVAEISGGTIIACGSYSMAEGFDAISEQCSILYNISDGIEAGTVISLLDADGNTLLTDTAVCSFSSMIMSCPEMQLGETYTVVIGDQSETITLTETSASYGDAQSTMFGGNMNWGGMQPGVMPSMPDWSGDGEMPSPPDWSEDGTMPTPPDWSEDGTMPTPPGWSGEGAVPTPSGQPEEGEAASGEEVTETDSEAAATDSAGQSANGAAMPTFPGGGENGMQGGGPRGMAEQTETASGRQTETAAETGPAEVTENQWIWVGACAAVLLLGLLIVLKYR